jgi:hypothetical protein
MGISNAATLYNSAGNTFGIGSSTSNSYRIAYEIYSETAGVSTVASRGVIRIELSQPLGIGESANLVIAAPVNADFNSAGANFKWILRKVTAGVPAVTDPIIGITPSAGLVTPNLPFSIINNAISGDVLYVQQIENWVDPGSNLIGTQGVDYTSLVAGAGVYVRPGLGATCTNSPLIKVDFTTPHETTPSPINFAYITPQFGGSGPATSTLTAELDTDYDFMQFIYPSGPYVYDPWEIYNGSFITITDNATTTMWIAYASESPVGSITFDLNSVVGESDASIWLDSTECDPNSGSTVFDCSAT